MLLSLFTDDGLLPPGDYPLTFAALERSFLVTGQGLTSATWDVGWRRQLVENMAAMVQQLWRVGIDHVYLDGSFVEEKDHPNDIDGYFECDLRHFVSGRLQRELNALDPHQIWTWDPSSRTPAPGSVRRQLPMWHRYRVEIYPYFGNLSGIRDEFGRDMPFPSAFRTSRRGFRPKGIVQVIR